MFILLSKQTIFWFFCSLIKLHIKYYELDTEFGVRSQCGIHKGIFSIQYESLRKKMII